MQMKPFGLLLLAVGLLAFHTGAAAAEPPETPDVASTIAALKSTAVSLIETQKDGQTVHFQVPEGVPAISPLKLPYFELETLGIIGSNSDPYVMLKGLPCEGCNDNKSIFLIRARGGSPANGTALTFHYPGTVRDRDGSGILHQSRLFFGKCLASKGEGVIIHAEEKERKRKFLQRSLFISEIPKEDSKGALIKEELLTTRLPGIAHTLHFVKTKKCTEVKGYDRISIPFSLPGPKRKK